MKSVISRLEALEKRKPSDLILLVEMPDKTEKQMTVKEYLALPGNGTAVQAAFRVLQGNNLTQLDLLLDSIGGAV